MTCDAFWDFDVDFTAACLRTDTHTRHRAVVTGNEGIVAAIEWPAAARMTGELLTPAEHDAVAMAGELWNLLTGIVGDGPARDGDLRELIGHIHAVQHAVLKQAAARAYPDQYRLLGGHPAGTPESTDQIIATLEGTA